MPRFNAGPVHLKFVMDQVALKQVFLRVLWSSHVKCHATNDPDHSHLHLLSPEQTSET